MSNTYFDRLAERSSQGTDFYPILQSAPSERDWERLFKCREGRLNVRKLPDSIRQLYGHPLVRIMQESEYWDSPAHAAPPANDPAIIEAFCRAWAPQSLHTRASSGGGVAQRAFANVVGSIALDGFHEVSDSLEGIAEAAELPNFLLAGILRAQDTARLKPIAKGASAEHAEITVADAGEWRICRLGLAAEIDEQDIVNDASDVLGKSLAGLGRAAQRAWLDLAWATILSNPQLEDGKATFHADHANLGTAALSDSSLGAAMAAIRSQVNATAVGDAKVHLNLQPRFLIVPPALEGIARRTLRLMKLDNDQVDLELRIESRLSSLGTTNPVTKTTVAGSDTNWLLTAGCDVSPWLLQGILQGCAEPRVRMSSLENLDEPGRYGLATAVSWDISCRIVDFRGCYFSSGTV